MKKIILFAIIAIILLLAAFSLWHVLRSSEIVTPPAPTPTISPPGVTEQPHLGNDQPQSVLDPTELLANIPLFGDSTNFNLPASHALVFAEAIRVANLDLSDSWGYFSFDNFYIILLNVSSDGVPLLMLIEKDDAIGWETSWNIIFGVSDRNPQRISEFHAGLGVASIDGEKLLVLLYEHDFGGTYTFYQVINGEAKYVSTTEFVSDFHQGVYRINEDIFESEDEYWEALEVMQKSISLERLLNPEHPGTVSIDAQFEAYLMRQFTREQAIQIFLDYAAQ